MRLTQRLADLKILIKPKKNHNNIKLTYPKFSRFFIIASINLGVLFSLCIGMEVCSTIAMFFAAHLGSGDTSAIPDRYIHGSHRKYKEKLASVVSDLNLHKRHYRMGLFEPDEFESEHLNIRSGYRQSSRRDEPNQKPEVWVFGGSTIFGSGVSDSDTIPASLESLDPQWHFINYGVVSSILTQHIFQLNLLLKTRTNTPAALIFYSGANEFCNVLEGYSDYEQFYVENRKLFSRDTSRLMIELFEKSNTYAVLQSLVNRLQSQSNLKRIIAVSTDADSLESSKRAEVYISGIKHLTKIAQAYHIPVYFFLQPTLLSGIEYRAGMTSEFEKHQYEIAATTDKIRCALAYEQARKSNLFFDLSDIFVKLNQKGNYFDTVHLGPDANALIAQQILHVLKSKM